MKQESLEDKSFVDDFQANKKFVLHKLSSMACGQLASFCKKNNANIKPLDVLFSLRHSIMSVYLWEMFDAVDHLSEDETGNKKLNDALSLLNKEIESMEDFSILTSILLDYKHVHFLENMIDGMKKLF